jgi:PAS domain S-box-containing protein
MTDDWNVPFRALIDAAPDGLVVCDQNGKLVLVNAEAERMFGYAHDELPGKAIEALIPEHVRPRHQHHLASYTAAPRLRPMGSNLDLRGRRKDGSEFPVEISLSPFETDRGVLIIAGVRDVTDRRQLERENKRANAYLVSAVDAVQDAFALFDERDRVMMVNSAARQLLGSATGESIVGRRFSDLLEGALAAGVFDVTDESRASFQRRWLAYHQAPIGTLEVRTGDGRHLRVTDRKTADHGTVMTIADITDDVRRA